MYPRRPVGSNYRLGGHTLQIGGAHIFFFFLGGGAYLCKLLGGHAPPPVPPIPTALPQNDLGLAVHVCILFEMILLMSSEVKT